MKTNEQIFYFHMECSQMDEFNANVSVIQCATHIDATEFQLNFGPFVCVCPKYHHEYAHNLLHIFFLWCKFHMLRGYKKASTST